MIEEIMVAMDNAQIPDDEYEVDITWCVEETGFVNPRCEGHALITIFDKRFYDDACTVAQTVVGWLGRESTITVAYDNGEGTIEYRVH